MRKRATVCLGNLSVHLSDANLRSLVSSLLDGIQRPAAGQDVRALIQTVGTVSRQVWGSGEWAVLWLRHGCASRGLPGRGAYLCAGAGLLRRAAAHTPPPLLLPHTLLL